MSQLEIPTGWTVNKVADVGEVITGSTPSTNNRDLFGDHFPFYKPADLDAGVMISQSKDGLSKRGLEKSRILSENSILVVGIGASVGKTSMITKVGASNQQIHAIIPNPEKIIPKFLYYEIISPKFQNQIITNTRITSIPIINKSKFEKLVIIFPSLEIQNKIIQKLDYILGQLEDKKKQIIILIEQNKERIKFFEKNWWSFMITSEIEKHPQRKEWDLKELGDPNISEIIMGQSPPSSTYNTKENGLPFFQGKKDFGNRFPITRVWCTEPKKIAKEGDILISVRAPVGSTNWAKEECCIGRGLSAIRVKIEPKYVYYFIKSLEHKLSKSGTGSVFNSIGKDYLYQIPLPVPSLKIQKKIVQNIKNAEEKFKEQKMQFQNVKQNYELKIKYINHIQSSILDSAFSGKLVN